MVGGISFSGLASGLDTGAIIQALLDVERIPIRQLETRRSDQQGRIDLIGTFRGLVQSLRDQAEGLGTPSGFLSFSAEVSHEGLVEVSSSSNALAGTHTIVAEQLAAADRYAFDPVASDSTDLATGAGQTVSFDYAGASYSVAIDPAASTLEDIAAAINDQAAEAVNAIVVNTGTEASPSYQLVVSGNDTGADFSITNLSSDVGLLPVSGSSGATRITQAANAVAVVDGLRVERSTNDFSDVLQGVEIELVGADPATTVSFGVTPDRTAIRNRLDRFVEAYNEVIDFINEQNELTEDSTAANPLFGDSLLSRVQTTLRRTLFGQSAGDVLDNAFGSLALVGIRQQSDGKLSIDAPTLDAKLAEDLDAFAELFVDSDGFDNDGAQAGEPGYYVDTTADTGIADDLMRALDGLLKRSIGSAGQSFPGAFDARLETLNDNIARINDQIDVSEARLVRTEESLVARFTALETLLGKLNSQQAFLNQSLLAS